LEQEIIKMQKIFLIVATLGGALAVGLGAFGAHALKNILEAAGRLDTYETAVKYHFYHVLTLLIVGLLMSKIDSRWIVYSGSCFIAGILLFSGSLYVLCFTQMRAWGAVTPFGGIFLILGWIFLALAISKSF
jgi:uncharacterized membrane protein YgdD (TMEM256/DUF423 family)